MSLAVADFITKARYLPGRSGIASRYPPVEPVVVVATVRHPPPRFLFWIFTVAPLSQAANASLADTAPLADRCPRRFSVTERSCLVVVVTVKLAVLVTVPSGVVTEIGPVVAPVGTVAVIWVLESTVNVMAAT